MGNRRGQCGQSTAEYAVVISVVIACVVGMQIYVKRGMQAKLKQASDTYAAKVGSGTDMLAGDALEQYEPYYTAAGSMATTFTNSDRRTKAVGGVITGEDNQSQSRTGSQVQSSDQAQDDAWD